MQPAAMQPAAPSRPSAWYYWLAPLFLAAGLGVAVLVVSRSLPRLSDALTQVVLPGQATLSLRQGKLYTVYYEVHSVVNGKVYNTNEVLSGLHCEVKSMDEETAVALRPPPNGPTKYTIGSRSGSSWGEFSVAQDGLYVFSCAYEPHVHGREVVLAVGYGLGALILKPALLIVFGTIGGVVLATLSFFWVYILRDQAIARAAAERLLPT